MNKKILSILCLVSTQVFAGIIYVKPSPTGDGSGSSWANASSLSSAVTNAVSGNEIWVQQGSYNGPVILTTNIKLYGGFLGTETLASQSNPISNVTVIDGNTSTRCIEITDSDTTSMIRGFQLINGSTPSIASGTPNCGRGGAISMQNSSVMIVNCSFTGNVSDVGGAVYIKGGTPTFVNCQYYGNASDLSGGAIYVESGLASFQNCLFYENTACEGSSVTIRGTATFSNCTFTDNPVNSYDTRCLNKGRIYDYRGLSYFTNSIIWENYDSNIEVLIGDPNGTITIDSSNIEGGWLGNGVGNISSDPLFIDPANDKYRVSKFSPCKNTGDNLALPQDVADLDWDGDTVETIPHELTPADRIYGTAVDMGAFEFNCTTVEAPLADPDLPDVGFGTSNRYITFVPTNVGRSYAIRVTLTSMPPPFMSFAGTKMWVDAPQEVSEAPNTSDPTTAGPSFGTFMLSRLTCNPVYLDWSSLGSVIAIYDDEIVPNATYDIQAIYDGCGIFPSANYSPALTIRTSTNWADVTGDCSVSPCTPPDGIANIVDVTAVQDKWLGVAIPKSRTDLNPDLPDLLVNIADVLKASDGINGVPYPFDGPSGCGGGGGGSGQ